MPDNFLKANNEREYSLEELRIEIERCKSVMIQLEAGDIGYEHWMNLYAYLNGQLYEVDGVWEED